jgi:hypothetical protein
MVDKMEIKVKLFENKKVVFQGSGIESIKKIDEMLKK